MILMPIPLALALINFYNKEQAQGDFGYIFRITMTGYSPGLFSDFHAMKWCKPSSDLCADG